MPEVGPPPDPDRPATKFAWAFAAYSALAVVATFPLVAHLSSRVPVDRQDSLWYVTVLWWNAHVTPLTDRWWDGFAFYPATGMMAFSDHMLGASAIASPLQWLGASAMAAYNLTFLLSFPLCAMAAHALVWTLTRRHDAAAISGLAYGFNPYRVAHLEHLELLLAFGMPLALAALHRYVDTRHWRWLGAFAAALTMQALSASYYALFFGVLLAMWMLWFLRPRAWRDMVGIAAAGAVSVLALSPIALGYARIHRDHNLTRDFAEVLTYSADLSSFVTASALSAVWGWTSPLNGGERQLFPGLTITVLAIAGAIAARRVKAVERTPLSVMSTVCWALAALFLVVAGVAYARGPWQVEFGWLRVSASVPYKPLSVAMALAILAIASSPSMRSAFQRRSALAFYLIAAAVLFLCSLGPRPSLLGTQILYEPPYAWLMQLPFFADGTFAVPTVRVPARFAMVGILALAVAGGLAFIRIASSTRKRAVLLTIVLAGIAADGWIGHMPLRTPDLDMPMPGADTAAVLILPLGTTRTDTAAMHWAVRSGRPAINGYHSYAPLSYHVLNLALAGRDLTALDALAAFGPVLIAADNRGPHQSWALFVAGHPESRRVGEVKDRTLFELPFRERQQPHCSGQPVAVAAVSDQHGELDREPLVDDRPGTGWTTPHSQRRGDALIIDLAHPVALCEVVLSMGADAASYPRSLRVATSLDGVVWETRFASRMGGSAFLAALDDPTDARMSIPVSAPAARYVRLALDQSDPDYPWTIADIVVRGSELRTPNVELQTSTSRTRLSSGFELGVESREF